MNNQTPPNEAMIRCQSCGTPFPARIYSYVDVIQEPNAKVLLLNGRLNQAQCPNCGTVNVIAAPLLYHDPTKELLIAMVPMELNMNKDEQERAIGQLMNKMPKDNFKAYMFNPRRAMTMQGLIDQVLEADGITKEMMDEQKARVALAQKFVEVESQEALMKLIQEHDADIDERLISTLTLLGERVLETGQQELANHIAAIQQIMIQSSSFGKGLIERQRQQTLILEAVSHDIQAMGEGANRDNFLDLALSYADQDDHLQALVGLVRPVFDYDFFQIMTTRIGQAPADERETMERVRDVILQMTAVIDQQQQAALQQAAAFLQAVVNHSQPQAMLQANDELIDDIFMQVLQANIQQAENQKNLQLIARLKEVQQYAYQILQMQMQPELRFVNHLLEADHDTAHRMLEEEGPQYGEELLEVMQAVIALLQQQGNNQLAHKLHHLLESYQAHLASQTDD